MCDICLVVLNWRNGPDTIECLQSIIDSRSTIIRSVVICDNDSGDESVIDIRNWAKAANVSFFEVSWTGKKFAKQDILARVNNCAESPQFVMIHTGANLGFAGGNNVGLEYLRQNFIFDAVLLLNNDTLLTAGAVEQMAGRFVDPRVGMCGCTVIYYHTPTKVQAFGGSRFKPFLGQASHIGSGLSVDAPRDHIQIESDLSYILGAALMISHSCLDAVGLMEESYFLYYEEIDWAIRAKRKGFRLAYAPAAEIYHKEGATVGSSSDKSKRSFLSEHYLIRSRLLFTKRFYPYFLPSVLIFTVAQVLQNLIRMDFERFLTGTRAILGLPFLDISRKVP